MDGCTPSQTKRSVKHRAERTYEEVRVNPVLAEGANAAAEATVAKRTASFMVERVLLLNESSY